MIILEQNIIMKRLITLLVIYLCSLSLYAQIDDVYIVSAVKLNLREFPNAESKSYGLLSKGQEVLVIDVADHWFKVSVGQYEGWLKSSYVIAKPENLYTRMNLNTGDSPECDNMAWRYDYGAQGSLEITVGAGADFAVKVMERNTGICIRAFYIKSGESIKVKDIPQNTYYLKVASGRDFRQGIKDGQCIMVFNQSAHYEVGEEILDFRMGPKRIETVNGKKYEVQSVPSYSLRLAVRSQDHSLKDNFDTKTISREEFNR